MLQNVLPKSVQTCHVAVTVVHCMCTATDSDPQPAAQYAED